MYKCDFYMPYGKEDEYINIYHYSSCSMVRLYNISDPPKPRGRKFQFDIEKIKNSIILTKLKPVKVNYFAHLGPYIAGITEGRFFQYLDNIEKYSSILSPSTPLEEAEYESSV